MGNDGYHSGIKSAPSPTPSPSPCPPSPPGSSCLCLFDTDRTLTGRQGGEETCSHDVEYPGIYDTAYGGGTLMLSEVAEKLSTTFCGTCSIGVISQGDVSGHLRKERAL